MVTYKILSDFLIQNNDKDQFYEFIRNTFVLNINSFELYRKQFDQFVINHDFRWRKKSKGRKEHFLKQYGAWLQTEFILANPKAHQKRLKPFNECSRRTKKRRIDEIRQNSNPEQIKGAYMGIIRDDNAVDAEIISSLSKVSTATKNNILKVIQGELVPVKKYTVDEALALMVDLKLSKPKYEQLRNQSKERNADLMPPYYRVVEAKETCYPRKEFIVLSELGAEIKLQALLNHTIERALLTCDINLIQELFKGLAELTLVAIVKWGMDGASGQSLHKIPFHNIFGDSTDAAVFMISLVLLQIKSSSGKVIWTNPLPSSTKFCRPIKFKFMKETPENSREEYKIIDEQIKNLKNTCIVINGLNISVSHKLFSTMVDGKMVDDLTFIKSHATCDICLANPSDMNDLANVKARSCNVDHYAFGISSLHCWIRFMECLLHISYKLDVQKWSAYSNEDKNKIKTKKKNIQLAYKREKGLNIDTVKPGSGNSNDGNTARRFFQEPEFAAKTTGLDVTLIRRFGTILVALCCSEKVDAIKFRAYAYATAELYVSLYHWYYMPSTVHKVLIHGSEIIDFFDLPIRVFSEEAQESRNKDFRFIREHNTRKGSRENTNEDIIHWLLVSSDPIISSMRITRPKKHWELDPEVLELLTE